MEENVQLSRRKLLGGIALVGVASAGAGASTMAALSDTETSTGNEINAGRMDLRIDGGDANATLLNVQGAVPSDSGYGMVTLKNANFSDVAGAVDVRITGARNEENGRQEMEKEAGDTSGGMGELGDHLRVRMFFENGSGDRTYLGDDQFRKASNRLTAGRTFATHYPLGPGQETTFKLEWEIPASAPTTIQTDSYEVDFSFDMMQSVLGELVTPTLGNGFGSTGFPSWTGDKTWDAKIRYGDGSGGTAAAGNAELAVDGDQSGGHAWTSGVTESFSLAYDADDGDATVTVGGDSFTAAVPAPTDGNLGIIAKLAGADDVEISNLSLDGIAIAPGAVTVSGSDSQKSIVVENMDFSTGFEVAGDVTMTYSSSPANEAGIQFDVQ
jgi:predicted ribosomally synthesized peptide with SipW-like signal peptide